MEQAPLNTRHAFLLVLLAGSACVCSQSKDSKKAPPITTTQLSTQTDTATTTADAAALKYVKDYALDEAMAAADMAEFTRSPHPFGSPRQNEIIAWLEKRLQDAGIRVIRDRFTATTPNPAALGSPSGPVADTLEVSGANIVALDAVKADASCVVALGTHFDTKIIPGTDYVGANDGGSSTIALIQQLKYFKNKTPNFDTPCDIIGLFFDGEEALLEHWNDGETIHPAKIRDNTYGSRSLASRLSNCTFQDKPAKCLPPSLGGKPLVALVLMDMIGSPGLRISRDSNSSKILRDLTATSAKALEMADRYDRFEQKIEDDHIPFLAQGVPAIDLIDFNNLDVWHRAGDTPEKLSYASIDMASRLAMLVAISIAQEPLTYLLTP